MRYPGLLLLLCCMVQYATAQDLSAYDTAAFYPMNNTAQDLSGHYDELQLENAPFAGTEGVYSNGIYVYDTIPDGSLIRTPFIAHVFDSSFAVQVEFRIDTLTTAHPVIVLGDSYRYMGLHYDVSGSAFVLFNGIITEVPSITLVADKWYTFTMIRTSQDSTTEYWLDGQLIASRSGKLDRLETDSRISNTHFGQGRAFHGYLRNLLVVSDMSVVSALTKTDLDIDVQVYPNPAGTCLEIAYPDGIEQWQIFTMDGLLVHSEMRPESKRIDLSGYQEGAYLLMVTGRQGHSAVCKWVKMGD